MRIAFSHILLIFLLVNSCTKNESPNYERFYLRTNGADLAIHVEGNIASRIFILLLHGGPGSNGLDYNVGKYSDLLEAEFAMVYLDQRGHGASQGNYGTDKVTMLQFAKDAEQVAKALKLKYGEESKIFMMGHSWGGLVGTLALLETKVEDYIEGWIEANGAHDMPKLLRDQVKMYTYYAEEEITRGNNIEFWQNDVLALMKKIDTNNISESQSLAMNRLAYVAERKIPELNRPDRYEVETFPFSKSPYGLAAIISSNFTSMTISKDSESQSLTNRLHEIKIPTLLIWGKYDFVTPLSLGQDAFALLSSEKKYFHILENSGHSSMISEPELFTSIIIDYIDGLK